MKIDLWPLMLDLYADVINSIQAHGRNATGQTIGNINVIVTKEGMRGLITAPPYIDALEYGRKPTGPNPQPGDPLMIENIKAWVAARGIDPGAAWAIKKKIDRDGYEGSPGVLSVPCGTDNVTARTNDFLEKVAKNYTDEIMDILSVLN